MLINTIRILITSLIIWVPVSASMEASQARQESHFTVLNVENQKIYTTKIALPTGEIAYFGFEPVYNENRSNKWKRYADSTLDFTAVRSFLYAIFMREDVLYAEDEISFNSKDWLGDIFPKSTTHQQEIHDLVKRIPSLFARGMAEAMKGIASGCAGLHYSVGDHIAYISKKPITGFFSLPDVDLPSKKDFDAYIDAYDDLIMVVSSFAMSDDRTFQHRGIFRNPMSMLRKDFQGIGILIHTLAAIARYEKFPELEIMTVNPDGNKKMREMLLTRFSYEEIVCRGDSGFISIKIEAFRKKILLATIMK